MYLVKAKSELNFEISLFGWPRARLVTIHALNVHSLLKKIWSANPNLKLSHLTVPLYMFEMHVIMTSRCRENQTPRCFSFINIWTLLNPRAYYARRRNIYSEANSSPTSPATRRAIVGDVPYVPGVYVPASNQDKVGTRAAVMYCFAGFVSAMVMFLTMYVFSRPPFCQPWAPIWPQVYLCSIPYIAKPALSRGGRKYTNRYRRRIH